MQAVNKTIKIQNLVLAYKCDHTSTDTNDHSIYITILAMKQDYWDECIVDGIKHKIIHLPFIYNYSKKMWIYYVFKKRPIIVK